MTPAQIAIRLFWNICFSKTSRIFSTPRSPIRISSSNKQALSCDGLRFDKDFENRAFFNDKASFSPMRPNTGE
jgi:hypothetical protein